MTNINTLTDPFGFSRLTKDTIGFDEIFKRLSTFTEPLSKIPTYPPYNIKKTADNTYVIEVAVAGFAEDELDVELKDGVLSIKGEQAKKEVDVEYQHKGISTRNFTRTFTLGEHVEVRGATVKNGILAVALELVVPEEKQPKKIAISFQK